MNIWKNIPPDIRPKVRFWLPGAAMDENDLRQEMRALHERGFGGVECVVLSSLPEETARSEEGWGTEKWDRMVEIICDEAGKLGMSVDLTIGPAWPIASPVIKDADDPAGLRELTWGEIDITGFYDGPLPQRRTVRSEGTPSLVAAMAYKTAGDGVLVKDSYVDLTGNVTGERITCDLPQGSWKLFAFWEQPAVQKINAGQTYTIDHLGKAGAASMAKYWDGVFAKSDLPAMESLFCDSLEYEVAQEWTPGLEKIFLEKRGYSLIPFLPVVGMANSFPQGDIPGYKFEDIAVTDMINADFCEVLTQCYCENHLIPLDEMAASHGKTLRYQVAYNKPFEVERCGLHVALPENEALGRTSIDGQKAMAAAAHLGRKPRHSFECAAEFGHSYGQDYDDLMWWIKRALMAGMNAQVLHGASYSGKTSLPGVEWPGYEGFGKFVSNYWNRTPDIVHARGCMDAITRMNAVFRKQARVDCAIFRAQYSSDGLIGEYGFYPDGGKLSNHGYSYEFVSESLLKLPVCRVHDGILDKDGVGYKCLIIPASEKLSLEALKTLARLLDEGMKIVWTGEKPASGQFYCDANSPEKIAAWRAALDAAWNSPSVIHVSGLEDVPAALMSAHIYPDVMLNGERTAITAARTDGKHRYYAVYAHNCINYTPDPTFPAAQYAPGTAKPSYAHPGVPSRKTMSISILGEGNVSIMDPWSGSITPACFKKDGNGRMTGKIEIEEDEMVILCLEEGAEERPAQWENAALLPVALNAVTFFPFSPASEGEISFLRSKFSAEGRRMTVEKLVPWHEMDATLRHFGGSGEYEGTFVIPDIAPGSRFMLELGNVCDTFTVQVNGTDAAFPDQVLNRADITPLVHAGKNTLKIKVVSNLYNAVMPDEVVMGEYKIPFTPRSYGIWEDENHPLGVRVMKKA